MLGVTLVGYSLLAWGVFSCSFLVMLSQPRAAVQAMLIAAAAQCASGLLLQQIFDFGASVGGTIVGGACLALLTQRTLARLLRRSDYALYQAF
jgi:hypothetical protein